MKKFNATLILVLFVNLIYAQNPLVKQWDYRFGGTFSDNLYSLLQTSDGGYILGGYSASDSSGDKTQNRLGGSDYWIIKIDSVGNKQWDKDFGGTKSDYFHCVRQTSDGGYILGGWSLSGIGGDKTEQNRDTLTWTSTTDYWIVKVDSVGNKQWDKTFGGTNQDFLYSLQQTTDGGYILGGYSRSDSSGDKTQNVCGGFNFDYWLIKTDSVGTKQWDKDFGGFLLEELYSMQQTTDGGFILCGVSTSDSSGDKTQNTWGSSQDYWIIKLDSSGNKQWDKDFGGTNGEGFSAVFQTSDGGYIIGGISASGISGDKTQPTWGNSFDYWIVKTDSLGNKQWDKDFGGMNDEIKFGTILQTSDGGYLMAGTSQSGIGGDKTENNLGPEQTWVVKTDSLGNKQWDKTLHTNASVHDVSGYAFQTSEECFIMANYTFGGIGGDKTQPSWGGYDYWITKFCDTTSTTNIREIINRNAITLYPNPTNTKLNFFLNQIEKIVITNLIGEVVLQKNLKGKVELDVSFLSPGIYFIKAGNEVKKFVKE